MAHLVHDPDHPDVPHNMHSADNMADTFALIKAHLRGDREAIGVLMGNGCIACLANLSSALLAEYIKNKAVQDYEGYDPARLEWVMDQMCRNVLSSAGD